MFNTNSWANGQHRHDENYLPMNFSDRFEPKIRGFINLNPIQVKLVDFIALETFFFSRGGSALFFIAIKIPSFIIVLTAPTALYPSGQTIATRQMNFYLFI